MTVPQPPRLRGGGTRKARDGGAKSKQNPRAIRESPLQFVGNDLSVVPQNYIEIYGRAWIFSENGHPFVRIRGHFPCQGNHPPLQRGAGSTLPTNTNPNLKFHRKQRYKFCRKFPLKNRLRYVTIQIYMLTKCLLLCACQHQTTKERNDTGQRAGFSAVCRLYRRARK